MSGSANVAREGSGGAAGTGAGRKGDRAKKHHSCGFEAYGTVGGSLNVCSRSAGAACGGSRTNGGSITVVSTQRSITACFWAERRAVAGARARAPEAGNDDDAERYGAFERLQARERYGVGSRIKVCAGGVAGQKQPQARFYAKMGAQAVRFWGVKSGLLAGNGVKRRAPGPRMSKEAFSRSHPGVERPPGGSASPRGGGRKEEPEPSRNAPKRRINQGAKSGPRLQELLGPDATWKNKLQYDSVQALVALERDVIMALKTGDGKTLGAVLPTRVENGYTVIVVPLKSLMDDWERCLKGFNIPYERWLGAENPKLEGFCNVILVSSDMCRTSTWKTVIAELNARRPVLRRVYDEAQFYGTKEDFGEETFETPYDMREMDTQVVLMSTTIPPRMQSYLADQFQLVNPLRISNTSDRPGLVTRIGGPYSTFSQQVNAAKDLIKQFTGNKSIWAANSRYIIFVNSYHEGKSVAKSLGLEFYHAHSDEHPITDIERLARYNRWRNGQFSGLVATSAITAGTDYPHVRFTIHIGTPWNATTYKQQAERAGRDGLKVLSAKKCLGYVVLHCLSSRGSMVV
ncbi:P-loop containing nucleoside triphosphate hydrolase protein [Mycena metata]|uniref:DNA 3'-5' helicase n=1 Tax=Mycena metata TaxID=1033252 RepID=A0AAD7HI81_9AGAR|nr:P-loop containing nucleoside triphosphate hydrolase protein [Mycena metata]